MRQGKVGLASFCLPLVPISITAATNLHPGSTVDSSSHSSNVQCAHTPELASPHPLSHQHQLDSSQRAELQLWEAPHSSLSSNNHIFWSSNFRSGSCFLKLLSPGYCRVSPFAFSVLEYRLPTKELNSLS